MPQPTKKITPFKPRAFPPRLQRGKKILSLLQKAKHALQNCSKILQQTPLPEPMLHSLLITEAIHSLELQKKRIKEDSKAEICDYLEALRYVASHSASRSPLTKKKICNIHKIVKQHSAQKIDLGRYRNRQNWIGPEGCTIDQAYFYPPAAKELEQLMKEFLNYANRKTKEPLLQLALLFAQLLIIHPFMDGNGRVARLMVPLFLYQKKFLPTPFFLLSSYLKKNKLKYFQTLYKTTNEGIWEDWIVFFLKGIIQSVKKIRDCP